MVTYGHWQPHDTTWGMHCADAVFPNVYLLGQRSCDFKNKNKKKHNKIVLLAKSKLNRIEVLISKTLIDSVISHDKFISINNVVKKYNKMKEEIKNLKI